MVVSAARPAAAMVEFYETNSQGPLEYEPGDKTVSGHPNNYGGTWLSYSDCTSNLDVGFPLSLTADDGDTYSGQPIEAWVTTVAGLDCGDADARQSSTAQCWQVAMNSSGATSVPAQDSQEFFLRVQDLVRGLSLPAGSNDLSYTPANAGTSASCSNQTTCGAVPIYVWFILFDSSGTNPVSEIDVGMEVELLGPAPPTDLQIGQGGGELILTWTPSADTNAFGYNIYIDPIPGQEAADAETATQFNMQDSSATSTTADVGATPSGKQVCPASDAGDDGEAGDAGYDAAACKTVSNVEAGPAGTQCPSVAFPGGLAQNASAAETTIDTGIASTTDSAAIDSSTTTTTSTAACGSSPSAFQQTYINTAAQVVGQAQTGTTVKGLVNGVVYTVTVSAFDGLNQNGPLATPRCSYPTPVEDFFSQYRAAGGLAGGGYCSMDAHDPDAGKTFGLLASFVGLTLAWSMRKRGPRPAARQSGTSGTSGTSE